MKPDLFLACSQYVGTVSAFGKYGFPDNCGEIANSRITHGTSLTSANTAGAGTLALVAYLLPRDEGLFLGAA